MIQWWGPVIYEYYAGTEANGFCAIDSEEWLAHKGSVGRPLGAVVHILDDEFEELSAREEGNIYFEGGAKFEYHNAPEKTAASRSFSMRTNMVGTHWLWVTWNFSISFRDSTALNCSITTTVAPRRRNNIVKPRGAA